jgi:hypothetical protein
MVYDPNPSQGSFPYGSGIGELFVLGERDEYRLCHLDRMSASQLTLETADISSSRPYYTWYH